jgi:general secretion pathway protein F
MKFEVRGLRVGGLESICLQAPSSVEARRMATASGLEVISVEPVRQLGGAWGRSFDLHIFSEEVAELLDAGLSVVEAVDTLADRQRADDPSNVHAELVRHLRQGHTFSAALEKMPHCFPPLYVGIVRAAERTSDLHGALQRYLEYSGRLDALRSKIVSALIYPAILMLVGGAVIGFLLGFVVPRFAGVYRDAGRQLPLLSRLLLDWGSFVSSHAWAVGGTAVAILVAAASWLVHASRNGGLEKLAALVPGVGPRIDLFRLSRLYLTVGTLLNGGMPVVTALTLSQGVVSGGHAPRLHAAAEALRRGVPISAALVEQQLTTPVSLRLLRAGEGTGRMGDLFIRAGRYHDNELGRWVDRFSKAFEPVLMSLIGVVVGAIVILLYLPIFDLAGSLG